MAASGSYENIEEVTKGNIYECRGNEYKYCIRERKRCYDQYHYRDALFYPVDNSRNWACPATYCTNSLDGWLLGTKDTR